MDIYSKRYFKNLVLILEDSLYDMTQWSIQNNDEYNKEIKDIKNAVEELKKLLLN